MIFFIKYDLTLFFFVFAVAGREIRAGEALEALSVVPPAMRHPPVLLRPVAQPADPAAAVATTAATTTHLYSNTSHPLPPPPPPSCPAVHSSYPSNGGGSVVASSTHSAASAYCDTSSSSTGNNGTAVAVAVTSSGPGSAFSGSAPSLIGPLLPSARRYVAVRLLTGETLQFDVEVNFRSLFPCYFDVDASRRRRSSQLV